MVEQCLKLFQTIRDAVNGQEELRSVVDQHFNTVARLNELVDLVKVEEALKTEAISSALNNVKEAGDELVKQLEAAAKRLNKKAIRRIVKALFPSPEDQRELEAKVTKLEQARTNLFNHVMICNVGLTRDANKSIKVNTSILDSMDRTIKERLGTTNTLRIKQLIEGRERTSMYHVDRLQIHPKLANYFIIQVMGLFD